MGTACYLMKKKTKNNLFDFFSNLIENETISHVFTEKLQHYTIEESKQTV